MCLISSLAIATALGMTATITSGAAAGTVVATSAIPGIIAGVANTAIGLGVLGGAAGTALSAVAAKQQGDAQAKQYEYQAQVAKNNAIQARQEGIEQARLKRMETTQKVGAQAAAMAANGLDVTQGTPLDVIEDTQAMGELDALNIQYNAETKAGAYASQATLDTIAAQNASKAGTINAISTGLNGLSDNARTVSSIWYNNRGTR